MTRLYIAGPMTLFRDTDWNFPAFDRAAAELAAVGFRVENPAIKGEIDGWEWADYLRYDLRLLLDCDGVATLDRWRESKGALLECKTARALGMPIKPWTTWIEEAE